MIAITVAAVIAATVITSTFGYLQTLRAKAALINDPLAAPAINTQLAGVSSPFILLGDSRVAQWTPAPVFDGVRIPTIGVGGITAIQLAHAIPEITADLNGRTVILQVGINDLKSLGYTNTSQEALVETTLDAISNIVSGLQSAGAQVIVTTVIPPGPTELLRKPIWTTATNEATAQLNQQIISGGISDADGIIDFDSTLGGTMRIAPRYSTDTLHLNEEAYEALSAVVEKDLLESKRNN